MQTVTVHLSVAGLTLLQGMDFLLQALKLQHPQVQLVLTVSLPLSQDQLVLSWRRPFSHD